MKQVKDVKKNEKLKPDMKEEKKVENKSQVKKESKAQVSSQEDVNKKTKTIKLKQIEVTSSKAPVQTHAQEPPKSKEMQNKIFPAQKKPAQDSQQLPTKPPVKAEKKEAPVPK